MYENLIEAISIIGLGYVGLPFAIAFAERRFRAIVIDNDSDHSLYNWASISKRPRPILNTRDAVNGFPSRDVHRL